MSLKYEYGNTNTDLLKYKTCYKEYTKVHTLTPTNLYINQKGFSGKNRHLITWWFSRQHWLNWKPPWNPSDIMAENVTEGFKGELKWTTIIYWEAWAFLPADVKFSSLWWEKKIVENKKTLYETRLVSIILLNKNNRYSFIILIIVSFWDLTKIIAITENWDILSQSIRTIWYF